MTCKKASEKYFFQKNLRKSIDNEKNVWYIQLTGTQENGGEKNV